MSQAPFISIYENLPRRGYPFVVTPKKNRNHGFLHYLVVIDYIGPLSCRGRAVTLF